MEVPLFHPTKGVTSALLHQHGGYGLPCFIQGQRGTNASSNGVVGVYPHVCSPVCAVTQNSDKSESTTQVLPTVDRTAGEFH